MKWRVILPVVFVLLLFACFAYLYVNTFVRKRQHAVILFVVDGLDLNTLHLARQQLSPGPSPAEPDDPLIGDARRSVAYRNNLLQLDSFWNLALLGVQDAGQPVSDEGAAATALACGARVDNGYVAMNARNEALRSLIYAAEQAQRATGLVTTSSLTRPTPVAFYSTTRGTPEPYRNAQDLIYSKIDVVLGGGGRYFAPATAANETGRPDGRDCSRRRRSRYTVLRTRDELHRLSTWRTREILGVFAPDDFYFSALQPEHSPQPSLSEMTRVAISCLNHNLNGYFLVVAPGLVARASEQNFGKLAIDEVAAVDDAVASAIEYAGPDALVLVTNNYSLGAVAPAALPAAPATSDALRPEAAPALPLWLAGPGGPPSTRAQQEWLHQSYDRGWLSTNAPGLQQPQSAFRFQPRALPLAEPAWLASRGEGSEQFRGFYRNTDLFDLVTEQFRWPVFPSSPGGGKKDHDPDRNPAGARDARLRPLKQLGQNFLHDRNLAQWLADEAAALVPSGSHIVEIGPGLGALTALLLAKDLRLTALEKDRGLCVFLRERFQAEISLGRLDLREGDALGLLPALEIAPALICGNLPYYISTPLLMECLRLPPAPLFSSCKGRWGRGWPARPAARFTAPFPFWSRPVTRWRCCGSCRARSFTRRRRWPRSW